MTVYQWIMVGFSCGSFIVGVLSLIHLLFDQKEVTPLSLW